MLLLNLSMGGSDTSKNVKVNLFVQEFPSVSSGCASQRWRIQMVEVCICLCFGAEGEAILLEEH
jgi:hypothetical protein